MANVGQAPAQVLGGAGRGDPYGIVNCIDGEYYVVGQQGELEELLDHRKVLIRTTDIGAFGLKTATNIGVHQAAVERTIKLNYWYLMSFTGANAIPARICRKITYLRVHALCKGFGDPVRNTAAHNVRYSDITLVANDYEVEVIDTAQAPPVMVARTAADDIPNWMDDDAWRAATKKKVTNMICMVAYFMRIRGHHWTIDSDDRYAAIWRLCLYDEDNPGLDWQYIAHHAYHFIYPDVLDDFWTDSCSRKTCAGTLEKRYNSAAAGTAVIGAVFNGAMDIGIVFPKVRDLIPEAYAELERCQLVLDGHRWAGSINRRFYGGPPMTVDEQAIGALAATILGGLSAVAGAAPLRNSPALNRAARNAPITGSLITRIITEAAKDDRMKEAILEEKAKANKE
jgi:hypothetical protein